MANCMKQHLVALFVLLFTIFTGGLAQAETALTVGPASGGAETTFTIEELLKLDQVEIVTANEFVDGKRVFSGPLIRDVLDISHANGAQHIRITAANDYQIEIDVEEFHKYDVILALSMDGVALSRRDKGPIWLIYPMSDFVELQDPVFNNRLIWQVVKVEYW